MAYLLLFIKLDLPLKTVFSTAVHPRQKEGDTMRNETGLEVDFEFFSTRRHDEVIWMH